RTSDAVNGRQCMDRSDCTVSGSEGRLRGRPRSARVVSRTDAQTAADRYARGSAAVGDGNPGQGASAERGVCRLYHPARPRESRARPGRGHRLARADLVPGDREDGRVNRGGELGRAGVEPPGEIPVEARVREAEPLDRLLDRLPLAEILNQQTQAGADALD